MREVFPRPKNMYVLFRMQLCLKNLRNPEIFTSLFQWVWFQVCSSNFYHQLISFLVTFHKQGFTKKTSNNIPLSATAFSHFHSMDYRVVPGFEMSTFNQGPTLKHFPSRIRTQAKATQLRHRKFLLPGRQELCLVHLSWALSVLVRQKYT